MNCNYTFPKRQVHLDFHTSPDIPGIGSNFSKENFQAALKAGNLDSITVFAKCHHGYTYYPTKVGTKHPNLSFDLLGEQLKALHGAGIKAPVYITVGWSKLDADTHPEWRQIRFDTKTPLYYGSVPTDHDDPDAPINAIADYVITGRVEDVLPKLISHYQKKS